LRKIGQKFAQKIMLSTAAQANKVLKSYLKARPELPRLLSALEKYQPKLVGGTVRNAYFHPNLLASSLNPSNQITDLDIVVDQKGNFSSDFIENLEKNKIEYKIMKNERVILAKFTNKSGENGPGQGISRTSVQISPLQKQINSQFLPANSFEEDASFRELKCNALFYDFKSEKILDLIDGSKSPEIKFLNNTCLKSDPSRCYRFFRFSAECPNLLSSNPVDENSIDRILQLHHENPKILCSVRPNIRQLKKIFDPKLCDENNSAKIIQKIIDLGLSEDMLGVNSQNLATASKTSLEDLAKSIENPKDLPNFWQAFNFTKKEVLQSLFENLENNSTRNSTKNLNKGIQNCIQNYGYFETRDIIKAELDDIFESKYFFDKEKISRIGKNVYATELGYTNGTVVPNGRVILDYLSEHY